MKKVKILWLFNDIMDLYGDSGNIMALTYALKKMDIECEIEKQGLQDELHFDGYDLIYMGPGKDNNAKMAATHLCKYKEKLVAAVENEALFLVTGNAGIVFGKSIEDEDGNVTEAAGVFEYTAKLTGNVFINDFTAKPLFASEEKVYGFINRTANIDGETGNPLFEIVFSQEDIGKTEGTLYKNFIRTWALGPILAKNPIVLSEIIKRMLKTEEIAFENPLQLTALEKTLAEF